MISQLNSPMTLICLIPFNSVYPRPVSYWRLYFSIIGRDPRLLSKTEITGKPDWSDTPLQREFRNLPCNQTKKILLPWLNAVVIKINIFLDQITTVDNIVDQESPN
ncbi:hypothetical protein CEXT_273201 [Caerostris extrusa]|uniref:Uncharacterized protein n=1 Tax=Caerostris extrusa TaxID=172846 RepID=A0AAV4WNP5_CAEEX|nr:hypothetical protein CEXT_273201 [Caerostris extrusa]